MPLESDQAKRPSLVDAVVLWTIGALLSGNGGSLFIPPYDLMALQLQREGSADR